jgi:hypothetical protein
MTAHGIGTIEPVSGGDTDRNGQPIPEMSRETLTRSTIRRRHWLIIWADRAKTEIITLTALTRRRSNLATFRDLIDLLRAINPEFTRVLARRAAITETFSEHTMLHHGPPLAV